jgi:hypothetical protein
MAEQADAGDSEEVFEPADFDVKIRSATSAARSCAFAPDSVEAKLSAMLSTREYEAIAIRSRERALQHYQESLGCEASPLVANRKKMEKKFGTANDREDSGWRLDPDGLSDISDSQLLKEVRRLEKKLANVAVQSAEVKGRVTRKQATLEVVLSQNQQLVQIRDT